MPFEVTTLRRDVETFGRHAKVAYTTSWEEDARAARLHAQCALRRSRRQCVRSAWRLWRILQAGRVRFIGEAEARIKEDYLRILRFFRFHAYYGKGPMDAEGLHAAVRLRGGLEQLSAERVAGEMRRILVAPGALARVEALFDYGLLTNVLGGVPRLVRFERLIAIETANGLGAERCAQARGACRLRRGGCSAARRRACGSPMPSRSACARRDSASTRRSGRGSGQGCFSIASVLTPTARACLLAWADAGACPDDEEWRKRLRFPTDGRHRSFRSAATISWRSASSRAPTSARLLKRLEQDWIASDFALDRDQLLAKARVHRRAASLR